MAMSYFSEIWLSFNLPNFLQEITLYIYKTSSCYARVQEQSMKLQGKLALKLSQSYYQEAGQTQMCQNC